jgi:hypothetical protein
MVPIKKLVIEIWYIVFTYLYEFLILTYLYYGIADYVSGEYTDILLVSSYVFNLNRTVFRELYDNVKGK